MEYVDQKFDFLTKLICSNNWESMSDDGSVKIEKTELKDSDIACFRASGFVNAPAEELLNLSCSIYDDELSVKKHDTDVSRYEIVEKLSDDSRLCYQVNSMPFPIWPRDLLYIQVVKNNEDSYWIYMYSVESPIRPRNDNQYVRAVVNISAYGFVPQENGTLVYRIVHVDPSGSIPTYIINNYATKTSKFIKYLQHIYPSSQ